MLGDMRGIWFWVVVLGVVGGFVGWLFWSSPMESGPERPRSLLDQIEDLERRATAPVGEPVAALLLEESLYLQSSGHPEAIRERARALAGLLHRRRTYEESFERTRNLERSTKLRNAREQQEVERNTLAFIQRKWTQEVERWQAANR